MSILRIEDLYKSFNGNEVIKGLNISVEENSIYGFIGNNGSGKTTTMKMVLGLLKQDSGDIFVIDEKVAFGDTPTNRHIGYLPDVPEFYTYMNAEEYLNLCAEITGIEKSERKERTGNLLKLVGLNGVDTRIRTYSRGMKQRLGIAQALINRPKLLICDEPTSALDPKGRKEILNILKKIAGETTVIFSTHILSDVERICDKAGVLYDGEIIREFDLKHDSFGHRGISIELHQEEYEQIAHKLEISHTGQNMYLVTGHSMKEIYEVLYEHEIYPEHLKKEKKSLEDAYLEVTT